jgi:ribosomal protein S9
LLEVCWVGDVKVDVVIDVNAVWCWCGGSVCGVDPRVQVVRYCLCEDRAFFSAERSAPLDLVEDGAVLRDKRSVEEESFGECGLRAAESLIRRRGLPERTGNQ